MKSNLTRCAVALLASSLLMVSSYAQELRDRPERTGNIVGVGSRLCVELVQATAQEGVRVQQGECRDTRSEWDLMPDHALWIGRRKSQRWSARRSRQ